MTDNSIIDLINQTHDKGKEKFNILKELVNVLDKEDVWYEIKDIMDFFFKHIPKEEYLKISQKLVYEEHSHAL